MPGSSSACNPDSAPAIWLCREPVQHPSGQPSWLKPGEREALSHFSGQRKHEYLTSRWLIRQAIAGASGENPEYCHPVPGRPVASESPDGWRLSISHSRGLSACATGTGTALGVDLEPCQRQLNWQKVVCRWFTPGEQQWLLDANCAETFLQVWTLKEAWLKATGRGIAGNLQTLEVSPGFELKGDRPERDWQACSYRLQDALVTLVFRHTGLRPPGVTMLSSPPEDFTLCPASVSGETAALILQRPIGPKSGVCNE